MNKIIKFIKSILSLVLISFIIIIGSNLFVIIKMGVSDSEVGELYFINKYVVKADNDELKIESFKAFMKIQEWQFIENYYGTMIFRKGNLQKEVLVSSLINI